MTDRPTPSFPADDRAATLSIVADGISPLPSIPAATADRYEVFGEIARGGMGVVYAARDAVLNRDVAVKVLREEFRDRPVIAARFVEEAKIAGQLQHPGVPPVYDLGTWADGRPFLAMKLIKGQTLAAILDPAAPDLPRRIAVFEQVCQTVAYAHSKNVLHRDLKPSNVMVGAFGEVQVMDWGLAKVLTSRDRQGAAVAEPEPTPPASVIETGRPADSFTLAGSILGTPQYMPPEQAKGDIDATDRRADVFALGAILCELLTGQPPYTGTADEVRAFALAGHLVPALDRLDGCGADPELIALAKRCLAKNPADRPADAGAVAAAAQEYRIGVEQRLRQAELERAAADARAAERRKRRRVQMVLAAAGVVIAGLILLGIREREQTAAERRHERELAAARAGQTVATALDQAEAALRADKLPDADTALALAEQRLPDADAAELRDRFNGLKRDRAIVAELDRIRDRRHTWVQRDWKPQDEAARAAYAEAFARYGAAVGDPATAEVIRRSPVAVRLTAALDDWLIIDRDRPGLVELLAAVDPDEFRIAFRQAVAARDAGWQAHLLRTADGAALPSGFLASVGYNTNLPAAARLRVLKAAWDVRPNDAHVGKALGELLQRWNPPRLDESLSYRRAVVALRPTDAAEYVNLGFCLDRRGDTAGAFDWYRRAVELDPNNVVAQRNLGDHLRRRGDYGGAAAHLRRAAEIDPTWATSHIDLGKVFLDTQDEAGAAAEFRKAIELEPNNAVVHNDIGAALVDRRRVDEAIGHFRAALAIDPRYALAHANLSVMLSGKQDWAGAEAAAQRAVELAPDAIRGQRNLAIVFASQGRVAEALRVHTDGFRRHPEWADNPAQFWRYNAACYATLCAAGQGSDIPPDADRPALRKQVFDWLTTDLAAWRKKLAADPVDNRTVARSHIREWFTDPDLASVRHPLALAFLPAGERAAWQALWADVRRLRDETAGPPAKK